jgi:hypothetical protein
LLPPHTTLLPPQVVWLGGVQGGGGAQCDVPPQGGVGV